MSSRPTNASIHTADMMILWNHLLQRRRKQGVLTTLFAFDIGHPAIPSLAAIFVFLLSISQWVS
jgi:hypothetical protein